ncbi:MAG TPA: galactokinase [Steroidobacteraceae bacterium]|nr:galactokinase [Steroidobacteraceae bacterium]
MADSEALRTEFRRRFGAEPSLYRAPARVNLIGEHTDYNGGFVLPAAIGFYTGVAAAPRSDGRLRMHSTSFAETVTRELDAGPASAAHWSDYAWGMARTLRAHGLPLGGADLLVLGEVPLGAGLGSSAALAVAVGGALASIAGRSLDRLTLAQLSQRAENDYAGTRCGIMDPFVALFGRAGHALCLDCRSLEYRAVPLEAGPPRAAGAAARILVCDTGVRHRLAGGEYNRRREECERGVAALARTDPSIRSLRDVSAELLERRGPDLDAVVLRRCRHVLAENARVLAAAQALEAGDPGRAGQLLCESHRSLRDDYEVSCDELDLMVELALDCDGVYGARLSGGGFGGCTVNLVRADAVARCRATITERYRRATGHAPDTYLCTAVDGAGPPADETPRTAGAARAP